MARVVQVTPTHWLSRGEVMCAPPDKLPLVIWSGIPGEPCDVALTVRGRNQVRGAWVRSDQPSAHRQPPPCERYDACGGCPLMHLDEPGQHQARREIVAQAFEDNDAPEIPIDAFHACPDGMSAFRHVVKVGFGRSDTGRIKVGAWARNTRRIVPIPQCTVATPVLRKAMASLAHHTIELEIEPWDPETGRGTLRAAVLRASRTTGEVLVTLVAAQRDPKLRDLADELARGVQEIVGVWMHMNKTSGNAIFDRDAFGDVGTMPFSGRQTIEEKLNGLTYKIGPGDFFQTNPSVAEMLYQRTAERLELSKEDTVVDLYCGVGGFSLQAAKRAGFVVGVEEADGAVLRARESARVNRLHTEFIAGSVLDILPELTQRLRGTGAKVVVDPARRGLEEGVIDAILALEPERIAYISCHPGALARDLIAFAKRGWIPHEGTELFDMFPNTSHVESLTILAPIVDTERSKRTPKRKLAR